MHKHFIFQPIFIYGASSHNEKYRSIEYEFMIRFYNFSYISSSYDEVPMPEKTDDVDRSAASGGGRYGRREEGKGGGRRDEEGRGGGRRDDEGRGGRRDDEGRGGFRRDEEGRGGGRRDEEGRGGGRREEEGRGGRRDYDSSRTSTRPVSNTAIKTLMQQVRSRREGTLDCNVPKVLNQFLIFFSFKTLGTI